jgi:hypothetical protein
MVKDLTLSWFSKQLNQGTAIDAYCQQYAQHTGKNDPPTSGDAAEAHEPCKTFFMVLVYGCIAGKDTNGRWGYSMSFVVCMEVEMSDPSL